MSAPEYRSLNPAALAAAQAAYGDSLSEDFGDNGPRWNFYDVPTVTDAFPAGTGWQIDVEPEFDNAAWIPYASVDLVEFGEWYESFGDYYWRPTEPGRYQAVITSVITADVQLGDQLRVGIGVGPYDAVEGQEHTFGGPTAASSSMAVRAYSQILEAPQNAIDVGKAYITASAFWTPLDGTTAGTAVSWYATIIQHRPGASYNQFPDM